VAPVIAYSASLYTAESPANLAKQIKSANAFTQMTNVVVAPDHSGLILSHDDRLLRVGPEPRIVWSVPAPNVTRRLAVSADGKVVVAFFRDGVIRWYRYSDGKEFLAFYQHPDEKRWVLWTPSGYYDAGPGGDGLIGWQVNQGAAHAADFFPVSRFRDTYHRPDVIDRVLETMDETLALASPSGPKPAAKAIASVLPPVVELLDATQVVTAETAITVRVALRTPADAPVTGIRARVNGQTVTTGNSRDLAIKPATGQSRLLTQADSTPVPGDVREIKITVPAEDCDVLIFAENRNGVSTPAYVNVAWNGKGTATQPAPAKPKLYVLAVGVSDYENPDYRLKFAAKDASDFTTVLKAQRNRLYRDVEVRLLTDRAATRDAVVEGLEWLQKQVTARDVGMLFLSGHGVNASDGTYYFAPTNFDANSVKRTGVIFTEIKDTLSAMAGKAVFFVDTCHSGNVLGGGRRGLMDLNAVVNELTSSENGVVVFSSATGREAAFENESWGNGAFTLALVEGVRGKADSTHTGRVTYRSLDYYISERVKELTAGRQHPVTQAPGGVPDFPIAVLAQ
jgi:hypothetical protein